MIEVEKRVFLSPEKLEELKHFFEQNGKFLKTFKRFTVVSIDRSDFIISQSTKDNPLDIRVRSTGENSKLTVKYGNWHNDKGRQEVELPFKTEDFLGAITMLNLMGLKYFISTYIERFAYEYKGFEITLDKYFTSDKCLMEVELLVKDQNKTTEAEKEIRSLLKDLNLTEMDKEEFVDWVQQMNLDKKVQLNLDKDGLNEWYIKWKDYIWCRV